MQAQGFLVTLTNTEESFRCDPEQNVLAAMERLRRKGIPVGCRNGGCGVCKVRVLTGEVLRQKMSRAVVSEDEEAQGLALACRIRPRGDLAVDVVGKMARAVEARRGVSDGAGADQSIR